MFEARFPCENIEWLERSDWNIETSCVLVTDLGSATRGVSQIPYRRIFVRSNCLTSHKLLRFAQS